MSKINPKDLSTVPKPDQVTALLIALLILIITNRDNINIETPKPTSIIKSDSI